MAKFSFGEAPTEDDILEIQGVEYRLAPFGMQAFRESMARSREAQSLRDLDDDERTERTYRMSTEVILSAVHEDDRADLEAHINRSVSPAMVSTIAAAIMRGLSDVDPTQPTSSSDGSSETGDDSTGGASDEASTPDN